MFFLAMPCSTPTQLHTHLETAKWNHSDGWPLRNLEVNWTIVVILAQPTLDFIFVCNCHFNWTLFVAPHSLYRVIIVNITITFVCICFRFLHIYVCGTHLSQFFPWLLFVVRSVWDVGDANAYTLIKADPGERCEWCRRIIMEHASCPMRSWRMSD